jgi:hypothetical protein
MGGYGVGVGTGVLVAVGVMVGLTVVGGADGGGADSVPSGSWVGVAVDVLSGDER